MFGTQAQCGGKTWTQIHRKGRVNSSHVKQIKAEQNKGRKCDAKHDTQGQNCKTKQEIVIETPNVTWASCTVQARSGCFPVAEVWPVIMDSLKTSSCRQSQGNGGAVQSGGEVFVMLKAYREEGHKRQRHHCGSEGLVTATDLTLIFSRALSSFLCIPIPPSHCCPCNCSVTWICQ